MRVWISRSARDFRKKTPLCSFVSFVLCLLQNCREEPITPLYPWNGPKEISAHKLIKIFPHEFALALQTQQLFFDRYQLELQVLCQGFLDHLFVLFRLKRAGGIDDSSARYN